MVERPRILIVEDEPEIIDIFKGILGASYTLKAVGTGKEFFKVLNEYNPDLVMLDINLPGMSGFEITRRIRSDAKNDLLKIILVSGMSSVEERLKGYEEGADDYIVKPFDHEELIAKVRVFIKLAFVEKELSLLNSTFSNQLKEQSEELTRKEKLSYLGMHVAEIVHNLRNPLTLINGYIEIIARKYPNLMEAKQVKIGIERLNIIINTILKTSKEQMNFEHQDVDLNEVIRSELELFNVDSFFKHEVQLDIEFEDIPMVNGVYCHFDQIIGNLLSNSIDALKDSENEEKRITARTKYSGDKITIEISDTGKGISDKDLERIFDVFYSTKKGKSKSKKMGTGVGLHYVKRMVENYGGEITVESKIDVGTKFTIEFPIQRSISIQE